MGDESSESSERSMGMQAEATPETERPALPFRPLKLELAPLEGSIYRTQPIELEGFPKGHVSFPCTASSHSQATISVVVSALVGVLMAHSPSRVAARLSGSRLLPRRCASSQTSALQISAAS